MLAVSSVEAAKAYYSTFKVLQEEAAKKSGSYKRLRVATIFSFAANEEQSAIGDITDESFDTSAMNSSAKEFWIQLLMTITTTLKPISVPTVTASRTTTAI